MNCDSLAAACVADLSLSMNAFKSAEKRCKSYASWEEVLTQDDVRDPHYPTLAMTARTVHSRGRDRAIISFDEAEDVYVMVGALDRK